MPDPKSNDVDFHEETTDPLIADMRGITRTGDEMVRTALYDLYEAVTR